MRLCRVDTVSYRADEEAIVDLKESFTCLIRVEREFLMTVGMGILNSASRDSNDFVLVEMRWPIGLIWKSCPTTRRPER